MGFLKIEETSPIKVLDLKSMKTVVVLPAYNCAQTLAKTLEDIPMEWVDEIVLVDDCSSDNTCDVARELGVKHIIKHSRNLGYGANQKTCYDCALSMNADVIIMLHPDYQYTPTLIPEILERITKGSQIVFASRMIKGLEAVRNGMPLYKYVSNRILTIFQNLLLHKHHSEYHTGYRAYTNIVLRTIDYHKLSNDFIFDNQFILQSFNCGFEIDEIYCPAKYEKSSSSINFKRSLKYGLLVLWYSIVYKFK